MDRTALHGPSLVALHSLAEHVLAAGLYQASGRIDLVASPGGFSTPAFGNDHRRIRVEGTALVVGPSGRETTVAITTLAAAANAAGIRLGAPAEVYTPVTPCDPDGPLDIDPATAGALAEWYALADEALGRFASLADPDNPATPILWPEHFDLAVRTGEVNYGACPPDGFSPLPYLYVGPSPEFLASAEGGFWNAPFGATVTWDRIAVAEDALAFFRTGHMLLNG